MISRRLFIGGAVTSVVGAQSARANDIAFVVGQVWTLSGTDLVEVRIVIDRLENWNNQPIAHISVTDLPKHEGGFQGTIYHLPFTELALRASVDKLVIAAGTSFPGFEAGYDEWKAANGGVFTITVQQAVAGILSQLLPSTQNSSPST